LKGQVKGGLEVAESWARLIERMTLEQREPWRQEKKMGASLANTGLLAAAVADNVAALRLGKVEMQDASYEAATRAYVGMLELSGKIGVRPTLAQIANKHSPLMQHIYRDRHSLSQGVYTRLNGELEEVLATELEARA
jgi:hypothetical protein